MRGSGGKDFSFCTRECHYLAFDVIFQFFLIFHYCYCVYLKFFSLQNEPWRQDVARRLPNLEKLDGEPIIRTEDQTIPGQTGRSENAAQQNGRPADESTA